MAKDKKATGSNLVIIVPDTHFPNENKEAVAIVKRAIAALRPSRTVFLGDLIDCGAFSAHTAKSIKELRQSNFFEEEIKPANQFIDIAQKYTKGDTIFVEGNHEWRVERFCIDHGFGAQAIYEAISPQYQLSKGRSDFRYIPYIQNADPGFSYYEITKNLIAVHGWSFAAAAARVHLQKARSRSVVFGHTHRQQSEASRDPFTKERVVAFSVGCLSEIQPVYMHAPNDWILGFGLVYISKSNPRDWTEYSLTIQNGRVILPDGKEINGD
jgi:predicted phosphodiesterase